MSLDKKIQKTFNPPPSLDGEDWLMPSDDLFESIEAAIYDEPKKKKRAFWFWLLPLLLISCATFFLINTNQDEALLADNIEQSNLIFEEGNDNSTINDRIAQSEERIRMDQSITNASPNINKSELPSTYLESKGTPSPLSLSNTIISETVTNAYTRNEPFTISNNNGIIGQIDQNFTLIPKLNNTLPNTLSGDEINRSKFDFPSLVAVQSRVSLDQRAPEALFSLFTTKINNDPLSSWNLKMSFGTTNWNFNLNENYLTALQPADFNFSNGEGYFAEIATEKTLSNRLSIGVSVLAERNTFESGHNSSIGYDPNVEVSNHSNTFGLTMASPLGFLESNIVVARSIDVSDPTELIINLENSHTVTNIDTRLYCQLELLQFRKFSFGAQLGAGINYLEKINNTLDHFSTSELGFNSHSSEIVKDQSDLNLLRPFFSIGLNVEYNWTRVVSVGFSHQYRKDLNAIYNSGDFSTLINRKLSGLYITRDF